MHRGRDPRAQRADRGADRRLGSGATVHFRRIPRISVRLWDRTPHGQPAIPGSHRGLGRPTSPAPQRASQLEERRRSQQRDRDLLRAIQQLRPFARRGRWCRQLRLAPNLSQPCTHTQRVTIDEGEVDENPYWHSDYHTTDRRAGPI